jgi:ubiquinone/menaquinone biosynthesis C-methylase UbiE
MSVQFPGPPSVPVYPDPLSRRRRRSRRDRASRLGLEPGMSILVNGPDPGKFVSEAAERLGSTGQIVVVTRDRDTADRLEQRWRKAGLLQVSVDVARSDDLPLADGSIDRVLCTGSLAGASKAQLVLAELRRVIVPGGFLAVEQHLFGRGFVWFGRLRKLCAKAGFTPAKRYGSPLRYLALFWAFPRTEAKKR